MYRASDIPIYIVDDELSVRESLRYMLEGYDFKVFDYDNGDDFLADIDTEAKPGCLILDIKMPGISGQEVQEKLTRLGTSISVIFLTGHGDIPMAVKAFRHGASDFLQKPISAAELVPIIKEAQKTSLMRYQKHCNEVLLASLSEPEKEMFFLASKGLVNEQIADKLAMPISDVERYRDSMMTKLGTKNTTELLRFYELIQKDEPA